MKKYLLFSAPLFIVIILLSCKAQKVAKEKFREAAITHKKVAVLPPLLSITGNLPKDVKDADLAAWQKEEADKIQEQLYFELLRKNKPSRKSNVLINYLPLQQTNALLEEKGITADEVNKKSATELASLLGADAVIYTRLDRKIVMSEKTSNKVAAGQVVADVILAVARTGVSTPSISTGRNYFSISVQDGKNGNVIWHEYEERSVGTKNTNEDVTSYFIDFAARKIPYRRYL